MEKERAELKKWKEDRERIQKEEEEKKQKEEEELKRKEEELAKKKKEAEELALSSKESTNVEPDKFADKVADKVADKEEEADKVAELISADGLFENASAPKRLTLFEKKVLDIQAGAASLPQLDPFPGEQPVNSGGRKTILGNITARLTRARKQSGTFVCALLLIG